MVRKSLYGETVEYFNGKEWKSISDYKPATDKVLIYNPTNHTVFLSTPINHIKSKSKKINHVTSSFFSVDISDEVEFYGTPRKDDGEDTTEPKVMPFNEICIEDYNYFSHYCLISSFNNSNENSSMLNDGKFEIMAYAVTMGECDGYDCTIGFDNKKESGTFLNLLNKNAIRYNYNQKDISIRFRLPRDIDLFTSNPLGLSNREIGKLAYFVVDNFMVGNVRNKKVVIKNTNSLDFVQMVLALNGMRSNIKNNELIMYKGGFTRLQSNLFKIEEKIVNGQYSFTIKNDHYIVLRSNGVIFVGGDFKK